MYMYDILPNLEQKRNRKKKTKKKKKKKNKKKKKKRTKKKKVLLFKDYGIYQVLLYYHFSFSASCIGLTGQNLEKWKELAWMEPIAQ